MSGSRLVIPLASRSAAVKEVNHWVPCRVMHCEMSDDDFFLSHYTAYAAVLARAEDLFNLV